MYGVQIRESRFSLYNLDEGEMYIKEFVCKCKILNKSSETVEFLDGIMHICSRSILFEPDNHSYPIVKFLYKYLNNQPTIIEIKEHSENFTTTKATTKLMKMNLSKLVEIPKGKITKVYELIDIQSEIYLNVTFEKIEVVFKIIKELVDKFNNKTAVFDFDTVEYLESLYVFKFDYTRVKSINEHNLIKHEVFVKKIVPLIEIPSLLMVTDARIYYQPLFSLNNKKSYSIKYQNIEKLFKRRLKLKEVGIEICLTKKDKKEEILFQFENEQTRNLIYDIMLFKSSQFVETNFSIEKYLNKWIKGEISNYEYLIALNSAANRTRNDLSQYPVFPWILKNYNSMEIDLDDPNNYRDLSKPIGVLNPTRFNNFLERYKDMPEPKFLYGVHYSNPGYVIGYLVRRYPHYMIKLHVSPFLIKTFIIIFSFIHKNL